MCDLEGLNLIDLTSDDESTMAATPISALTKIKAPKKLMFSNDHQISKKGHSLLIHIQDNSVDDHLDNTNAIANYEPEVDPFETVEQAIHLQTEPTANVEKLLSLSDDNIPENDPQWNNKIIEDTRSPLLSHHLNYMDVDNESPPVDVTTVTKHISIAQNESLSVDAIGSDSDTVGCNKKLKKTQENRNNLLKLSLTNAVCNSPIAKRSSLEGLDLYSTPQLSILLRKDWSREPMLASESPIKFVDDDFPSDDSQQFLNAEKKFEEDLKMMTIHIPEHLPTLKSDTASSQSEEVIQADAANEPMANDQETMLSLSYIKDKLKNKTINQEHPDECMSNPTQNADALIQSLESLIKSKRGINNEKKKEATLLLEALKTTLSETEMGKNEIDTLPTTPTAPTLKHQGACHEEEDQQPLVNEMPSCMINSAATFDGETNEEKDHLNLPEISPISPIKSLPDHSYYQDTTQQTVRNSEMNEIHQLADMLNKLLKTTSTADTTNDITHNSDGLQGSTNTFIVVMNNNDVVQQPNEGTTTTTSLHLPNAFDDCDTTQLNEPRRRSQSLSLHDKVKIIKLPSTPVAALVEMKKGNENTLKSLSPCNDDDTFNTKTPSKMLRRNSYSSTPYPKPSTNSSFNTANPHFDSQKEDVKHENVKVKAMPLFSKPLPLFKMNTKKKPRTQTESIVRSSQPMKATLKMPPSIITTPATPSKVVKRLSETRNARNKSLVNASEYLNACSTPALVTTKTKEPPMAKGKFCLSSATAGLSNMQRRSMSDFKSKSPLKARVSNSGVGTAASGTMSTMKSPRLSLKAPIKVGNKLVGTTSPAKPPGNGIHRRASMSKSTTTLKNKENKRP